MLFVIERLRVLAREEMGPEVKVLMAAVQSTSHVWKLLDAGTEVMEI
jgi:hypothetical protein